MKKLIESIVKFNVNGKPKEFIIVHNLPKVFGLNLQCAVESWVERTNKYTAQSLCDYIRHKDTTVIAMPKDVYDDMQLAQI